MSKELSWDEARAVAVTSFAKLESELISISKSAGRVAAEDLFALSPLPFYDTSAMDGWVVNGAGPWKIVGEIPTGYMPTLSLKENECARIGTGGIIPEGATAVIRWEHALEMNGEISGSTEVGKDIRLAGLECRIGDQLVTAGTRLQPALVGNLAAAGHDDVPVTRKPRVALFFLGDELVHSGLPRDGKIRDSLGVQVPALLSLLGVEVVVERFIDDEFSSLVDAVKEVVDKVDLIVTTGGTADGPRDHVHPLLDELGATYLIDRVKARPGHPSLLAELADSTGRRVAYLGLPGNPQSALVCIASLGQPLIASLQGLNFSHELAEVVLGEELESPAEFNRLVAGVIEDGKFYPAQKIGSNMLRGLAHSTGFAVLNAGKTPVGGSARWLPIPRF